jgi:cation transport ATPase
MHIARQSIWVGLAFSGVAMVFASAGYITPVFGALLQEVIDVAVIFNALRASARPAGNSGAPGGASGVISAMPASAPS